jgi:hypothetical protein
MPPYPAAPSSGSAASPGSVGQGDLLNRGSLFNKALSHFGGEGMKLDAVPSPRLDGRCTVSFVSVSQPAGGDSFKRAVPRGPQFGGKTRRRRWAATPANGPVRPLTWRL